jgi:hypothetical protein
MYLQNKYTCWYNNIIQQAQSRILSQDIYTEKHHVIPRSLGGNNSNTNIAILTAKEHFLCHLLLTKMTTGNAQFKMIKALTMMMGVKNIGGGRYIANSKWYAYARKHNRQNINEFWTRDKRQQHSEILKKYNTTIDKTSKKYLDRNEKIKQYHLSKVWTEKAIQSRLDNCRKAANTRKGQPWTNAMRQSILNTYVKKNLDIALQIITLHDAGLNNLQISKKLDISWEKVKYSLQHRLDFETYQRSNR